MTVILRRQLLLRALILAGLAALIGLVLTVFVFSPAVDPLLGGGAAARTTGSTVIRLLLAGMGGVGLAAGLGLTLFGAWSRDLDRAGQILQDAAPPADDSDDRTGVSGNFAEAAARLADSAHRGSETGLSLRRLEAAVVALGRRFEGLSGDDLEPWRAGADAGPAEQALLRGLNGWIEAIRGGRDRTAGLLADVEDHLVGVHETIDDVTRALAGREADEARNRLLRLRAAVLRVERELAAVRRRMGGAPVERLTESDFIGPEGGGPATQE